MTRKPVMIITGCSAGLGKKLFEYYKTKEMHVVGCSRSKNDTNIIDYYSLDVSNEKLVKNMLKDIRQKYGRLDYLINNAAKPSFNHTLISSVEEVTSVLDTNFIGSFIFSRESSKLMKKANFGRIINISSFHVPLSTPGTSIYGASKKANEHLSKVLSKEIYEFGITVNTLSLTAIADIGMEKQLSKKSKNELINNTITKKLLRIVDITHAIDFLVDKKSQMITNQILYLEGI